MEITFDRHEKLIGAWLFSQVIQRIEDDQRKGYPDKRKAVALRSTQNFEGVDYLLTRLDKKIKFLKNGDELQVVYYSKESLNN